MRKNKFICLWKCNLNHTCTLLCSKASVKTQERHPGGATGSTLKSLALCATAAKNAGKKLGITVDVFGNQTEGGILLLHRILMPSHVELLVQFFSLSLKTNPVETKENPDKVK